MKTRNLITYSLLLLALCTSCHEGSLKYDASGIFETTEVVVSAEANGKINALNIEEGLLVKSNVALGYIDTTQLFLKKMQLLASIKATQTKATHVPTQIAALKQQIATQKKEQTRFENLVKLNAANQKQLDDINAQISLLQKQLAAQIESLNNANQGITQESSSLDIQIAQTNDLIQKSIIISPIQGTILSKYVETGEYANAGKPLFKVADIQNMFLRAYITADQLTQIKIGQAVSVYADMGKSGAQEYSGTVSWISSVAEFTPKTIQTRDERANQVYAVKIAVKNTQGLLKEGMYGEVKINK